MGFQSGGYGWSTGAAGADVVSAAQSFEVDCPSDLQVRDWVYVTGPAVAGRYQVAKADVSDPLKVPAVGLVTEKPTSTTAVVFWEGEVNGFSGLAPRRVYYLQPDGAIALTPPSGGGFYVQRVGTALDSNVLLVALNLGLIKRAI